MFLQRNSKIVQHKTGQDEALSADSSMATKPIIFKLSHFYLLVICCLAALGDASGVGGFIGGSPLPWCFRYFEASPDDGGDEPISQASVQSMILTPTSTNESFTSSNLAQVILPVSQCNASSMSYYDRQFPSPSAPNISTAAMRQGGKVSPLNLNQNKDIQQHVTTAENDEIHHVLHPSKLLHLPVFYIQSYSINYQFSFSPHKNSNPKVISPTPSNYIPTMAKSTSKTSSKSTGKSKTDSKLARGAPAAQKVTLESLGKTRAGKQKEKELTIAEKAAALAAAQTAQKAAAEAAAAKLAQQARPAPLPDDKDEDLLDYDESKEAEVEVGNQGAEEAKATEVDEHKENTNEHINDVNNPGANSTPMTVPEEVVVEDVSMGSEEEESPASSPVKKRSKRDALASLVKPTKPAAKPQEPKRKAVVKDTAEVIDETPAGKSVKAKSKTTAASSEKGDGGKQPASALRKPKYSTVVKEAPASKEAPKPHDHAYKRCVIEASVDLGKATLVHLESNAKRLQHAISVLSRNLEHADEKAVINHEDPLNPTWIGPGGIKVPDNMTKLRSFILNMNINQFKDGNGRQDGDALDSLGGEGKRKGGGNKTLYFVFHLSCDVEPTKLIDMVAFEWCAFGNMLRVKELQEVKTETPIVFYNLSTEVSKAIIESELSTCFKMVQQKLASPAYADEFDWDLAMNKLPPSNLRNNVPRNPKSKGSKGPGKLPNHLQNCKRAWHIECSTADKAKFLKLIRLGKKMGVFKEVLGPHVHPTELATYESSATDIKRSNRFHKDHMNYIISMTVTEIEGIQDVSDTVSIYEGKKVVQVVSGKYCLISLFKLRDGSSVISEVHQAEPGDPVYIVHPNIPEAEQLIQNFAKHPAGFLKHYLASLGVDAKFVKSLMSKILEPSLVHDAMYCQWDEENRVITTQEELEEDEEAAKLSSQSWFKDIVAQFETAQGREGTRKSKNYASAAALYDLDATRSVQTTHEANDGEVRAEELDGDSLGEISEKGDKSEVIDLDGEDASVVEEAGNEDWLKEGSSAPKEGDDFQSGSTPTSVEARSSTIDHGQEGVSSTVKGDAASATEKEQAPPAAGAEHHDPSVAGSRG